MSNKNHDHFFRGSFKERRVALEAIHKYLPDYLRDLALVEQYELVNESFISPSLQETVSDVLIAVPLKDGSTFYIYQIYEHQSTQRPLMPLRLLELEVGVYHYHIKTRKKNKLPLLQKVVIYNGEKPWTQSTNFFDHFEVSAELARTHWNQPFTLRDLGGVHDDEIKENVWYGLLEFMLKHVHDEDMTQAFDYFLMYLSNIEKDISGLMYLELAVRYLLEQYEAPKLHELVENVIKSKMDPEVKERIMTVADVWRAEAREAGWEAGEKAGVETGIEQKSRDVVQNMIAKGYDPQLISEATGIPLDLTLKYAKQ